MKRTIITEAVILKTTPFGEIHKNTVLFTREYGILHAIAYGALKGTGKLRSIASAFASGTVYLYNEPVKGSYKITDMDVRDFFIPLRENLRAYYAASLWSEMVLVSHGGGGSSEEMFDFFRNALKFLSESTDEQDIMYFSIQYIWHFLNMLGIRPEPDICTRCENPVPEPSDIWYSRREKGFVCENCRDTMDILLSKGSRKYLEYTAVRTFAESIRIRLTRETASALKRFMFVLAETALEHPLNTLKAGDGIV